MHRHCPKKDCNNGNVTQANDLHTIRAQVMSTQQTMNTQYLQDLVRALEFYIAQQQRSEIANNSQTINWFLS